MNRHDKFALLWLTTAIGAVLFVTLQSFSFVNDYVKSHGSMPAITFEAGALWMFSVFYGAWIVTALLAIVGTRTTQWIALILGGTLVCLNALGGIVDGLRDGGHIAFSAVFFITLPGAFATVSTWRHIRNKGATHVDE
ncbi:hypothetical protein [Luteibacter sp. SG786]|uniref:hypothetical protein n=1 Tax=Luteibacter sp. SG786 TaxID=2587130 RepID=UPI001423FCFD|nr:hypothetical protein [Luteibacter sp. SG786]NII55397.1 hypothetical protein [Luteibacter sp. SG786]